MNNTQTVSHQKVVLLLVFLCAAIMSSVFIFHMSHKPATQSVLTPDEGLLFAAPRDIKSFNLVSAESKKFSQQDFLNHWTLLFFGFTHCNTVCPTTMDLLNRVYSNLHGQHANLQVVLISLDPERDSPDALADYTHKFNPNFIGVSGKTQELRKLQSQLGVFSGRDTSSSENNYQIQHTSSVMLIDPKGRWVGFFKFGMNVEQLTNAVDRSLKSLKNITA